MAPWKSVEPDIHGTPMSEPLSLSPQEAANYIGLSKPTVYRLLAAGTLRGKRHGSRTLIDGPSLRAYYAGLPDYAPGNAISNAPRPHVATAGPLRGSGTGRSRS
jgi:excisionase family DNA binding protein